MPYTIDIHHILAREALEEYGSRIAALFQLGEFNPFGLDNNINKMGLVNDPALADALRQLSASSNNVLRNAGLWILPI